MDACHVGCRPPSRSSKPFATQPDPARQQFGPNEDFDKYPRMLERDMELAKGMGKPE